MCGIAIQYRDNFIDRYQMNHRGSLPWITKKVGDYTAHHKRLPLQTTEFDRFSQPIETKVGTLLFNGEIFNYPKHFENDVEFLVDFFSQYDWRPKLQMGAASKWDGFWAICFIEDDMLYAFTDPLGQKQLYHKGGCISSEIKPLLEETEFHQEFSMPSRTYNSPFRGVNRILPNILYRFQGEAVGMSITNLCHLLDEPHFSTDLKALMEKSVKERMINLKDNNTLFVSGGLDSTIILKHLMDEGALEKTDLLSIGNQEDQYLNIVEDWCGKEIKRISLPENPNLLGPVYAYEYPVDLGSVVPQFHLCKATKGSVIYTGDGADEVFSGYNRALREDTWYYDVLTELPFYHNIRLDRMGMFFTKEIRCPFLSHDVVRLGHSTPWDKRKGKAQLKEAYKNDIPGAIIDRAKNPLRIESMRKNKEAYKTNFKRVFESTNFHL